MKILKEECIACGRCVVSCPVDAITLFDNYAEINDEVCVECYNCHRYGCPTDAIKPDALDWPRSLRESLSNPISVDDKSGVSGRGTAEMKTNEVTGRIQEDSVGLAVELGRPGVGSSISDVEKVCMAISGFDIEFEALNPITYVMEDESTGKLSKEVTDEKVLSAIVEVTVPVRILKEVLNAVIEVSEEIDTVFSLGLSSLVKEDGSLYFDEIVSELGIETYDGGKTNVGLGKPKFEGGKK